MKKHTLLFSKIISDSQIIIVHSVNLSKYKINIINWKNFNIYICFPWESKDLNSITYLNFAEANKADFFFLN